MFYYVGLEPYESRYTLQLTEWTERVLKRRAIEYHIVQGQLLDTSKAIVTGQVLDAHGRSYWALSQMMELVKLHREGKIRRTDAIFFEDMFHPGIEALPYIFDQISRRAAPNVWVRCLAQTIDPDDFVNAKGMACWMRPYETMTANFVTGILASNEEMVAHLKIAGLASQEASIYNISGLSFGKAEVQERIGNLIKPFDKRPYRIVYAARFDAEKQPHFFLDLVERFKRVKQPYFPHNVEFVIAQGGPLKSTDEYAMTRARYLQDKGELIIMENLSKNQYYDLLNHSRVMFNCALQDWTSNTVSEADALGCNVVFPAYRSFPEVFANDHTRLYVPWSLDDALEKVCQLIQNPSPNMGKISDWTDGTIDRMLDIMDFSGSEWDRSHPGYRSHVSEAKY